MQGRIRAAGLAFAIALVAAAPARAAVFTVTTNADTPPGQIPCTALSCSLRSAVEASNQDLAADTIVVPASTYTLTQGALDVSSTRTVTISGAGAAGTIITASGLSQVLTLSGEASATLSGLTLADGTATSGDGGNVSVGNSASLSLDHVRVTNGVAFNGGGIAASSARAVVISSSLIDNNGSSGLYVTADTSGGTAVAIRDSTVAFNRGAGLTVLPNAGSLQIRAATIAANSGVGVNAPSPSSTWTVGGSIVAGNSPSNCAAPVGDAGGNVESGSDCGLAGHQNTDPQLATALTDAGGQTPVLPIAATSPAVDIVPSCFSAADQRDQPRPQGPACDAGAYEVVQQAPPPPPPPVVTPTPTPGPVVTPVPQKSVAATPAGTVLVRAPGGKFVPLDPSKPIPLGSTIDTRDGSVLISALLKPGAKVERATFSDGIFKITQTKTTTDLTLTEALAKCANGARAAAEKPKSRKLWGNGSGSFRTRGQYSAATVRGTEWLVQDSCAGTLTRVKTGVVSVRDTVRRKTIVLRGGKHYLARPPKRR